MDEHINKVCRWCPGRTKIGNVDFCNLLQMTLSIASISVDCPFEDLDLNMSLEGIITNINFWWFLNGHQAKTETESEL